MPIVADRDVKEWKQIANANVLATASSATTPENHGVERC